MLDRTLPRPARESRLPPPPARPSGDTAARTCSRRLPPGARSPVRVLNSVHAPGLTDPERSFRLRTPGPRGTAGTRGSAPCLRGRRAPRPSCTRTHVHPGAHRCTPEAKRWLSFLLLFSPGNRRNGFLEPPLPVFNAPPRARPPPSGTRRQRQPAEAACIFLEVKDLHRPTCPRPCLVPAQAWGPRGGAGRPAAYGKLGLAWVRREEAALGRAPSQEPPSGLFVTLHRKWMGGGCWSASPGPRLPLVSLASSSRVQQRDVCLLPLPPPPSRGQWASADGRAWPEGP